MLIRKFIFALLFTFILPYCSFSQGEGEYAVRPKYAPWSEKDRNVVDELGRQGIWKFYTRDRLLLYSVSYKDNIKHGPSTKYYSYNGGLREESNYFYGKRDSTYITYYLNGQVNTEGNYADGKRSGDWTAYYRSSGALKYQGHYNSNRRTGEWTFYSSKGYKVSTGNYVNGKKEGDWTFYARNGKVKGIVKYNNGVAQLKDAPPDTPKKTTKPKGIISPKKPPAKTISTKSDTTKTGPKEN